MLLLKTRIFNEDSGKTAEVDRGHLSGFRASLMAKVDKISWLSWLVS
jgi:hypothetical protein